MSGELSQTSLGTAQIRIASRAGQQASVLAQLGSRVLHPRWTNVTTCARSALSDLRRTEATAPADDCGCVGCPSYSSRMSLESGKSVRLYAWFGTSAVLAMPCSTTADLRSCGRAVPDTQEDQPHDQSQPEREQGSLHCEGEARLIRAPGRSQ